MTLAERIVTLDGALDDAGLAHAFGGAIALAYWTLSPRGTTDVDVNIFLPAEHAQRGLDAMPDGVDVPATTATTIAREGQARVFWDETPVDLFFDYAPVHADAALHRREVPFAGGVIPVLGPVELAVFKAMFDRTRDWADIEAMLEAGTLDVDAVRESLATMLDRDDNRFDRLDAAVRRARGTTR